MIALITGSRNWIDRDTIEKALCDHSPTEIIHGAAPGADLIAHEIAQHMGIVSRPFPADWDKHGKSAGPIRNLEMIDTNPDIVLAFHNDLSKSKGTLHCVSAARRASLIVWLYSTDKEPLLVK